MIFICLFLLLIACFDTLLHGALTQVFPMVSIFPMLVLVFLSLLSSRSQLRLRIIVLLAAVMSIVFATTYTTTIGVYIVAYIVPVLFARGITKIMQSGFLCALLGVFIVVFVSQAIVYAYYVLQGYVITLDMITHNLLPTILTNMLLFFVVYPMSEWMLHTYKLSCENQMLTVENRK